MSTNDRHLTQYTTGFDQSKFDITLKPGKNKDYTNTSYDKARLHVLVMDTYFRDVKTWGPYTKGKEMPPIPVDAKKVVELAPKANQDGSFRTSVSNQMAINFHCSNETKAVLDKMYEAIVANVWEKVQSGKAGALFQAKTLTDITTSSDPIAMLRSKIPNEMYSESNGYVNANASLAFKVVYNDVRMEKNEKGELVEASNDVNPNAVDPTRPLMILPHMLALYFTDEAVEDGQVGLTKPSQAINNPAELLGIPHVGQLSFDVFFNKDRKVKLQLIGGILKKTDSLPKEDRQSNYAQSLYAAQDDLPLEKRMRFTLESDD